MAERPSHTLIQDYHPVRSLLQKLVAPTHLTPPSERMGVLLLTLTEVSLVEVKTPPMF